MKPLIDANGSPANYIRNISSCLVIHTLAAILETGVFITNWLFYINRTTDPCQISGAFLHLLALWISDFVSASSGTLVAITYRLILFKLEFVWIDNGLV